MQDIDDQAYVLHASVCQTLANPTRLKILNALRDQEIPVAELARRTGTSMPNLSQHLAILRQRRWGRTTSPCWCTPPAPPACPRAR